MTKRRAAVITAIPKAISPGDSFGFCPPDEMEKAMAIIMSQVMMMRSLAVNAMASREETSRRVTLSSFCSRAMIFSRSFPAFASAVALRAMVDKRDAGNAEKI